MLDVKTDLQEFFLERSQFNRDEDSRLKLQVEREACVLRDKDAHIILCNTRDHKEKKLYMCTQARARCEKPKQKIKHTQSIHAAIIVHSLTHSLSLSRTGISSGETIYPNL